MVDSLSLSFPVPRIKNIFFPPLYTGGQPKDSEFMALFLEGGAVGISYVLLDSERMDSYSALRSGDFIGSEPGVFAREFGSDDPVKNMLGLAALNAICRHVFTAADCRLDFATDSLGMLSVAAGDRVGMVGLFTPLIKRVQSAGAELVILEKRGDLIERFPEFPITMDKTVLRGCNKVLCTSITVCNNTIDDILANCDQDAQVAVIGPTAGYFPDPLFKRGVDIVGGTLVTDGDLFYRLISERERWGPSTRKFCFQKADYDGMPLE